MKSRISVVGLLLVFITVFTATAQHKHPSSHKKDSTVLQDTLKGKNMKRMKGMPGDAARNAMPGHPEHHMDSMGHMQHSMPMGDSDIPMGHSYSLNLPMSRNGSGTGWLPTPPQCMA